jgi:hypothetical protein
MLRRSSTSRSIGNRSDFATTVNGDADSVVLDEDGDNQNQANEHFTNYVTSQLNRVRSRTSLATYEDEFETQLDGTNGH